MPGFTFESLTPTSFLLRSATVFAERTAVIDRDQEFSYRQFADRSLALTGMLASLDVGRGDRVAALCANSHVMLELHNGVPLRGATLVALNVRLAVPELNHLVRHSGAKVLIATTEFADAARKVAAATGVRLVLAGQRDDEYEQLLIGSEPARAVGIDEMDLLAINYTSGTTGTPKGVMYHHRGALLQALAMAFHTKLDGSARYLWTLPMFHCNGWCFTWAVTAAGGTHVCLSAMDPDVIWQLLHRHSITHLSAAPTVLSMIAGSPAASSRALGSPIQVSTGGAPPSPTLLARLQELRMDVLHLYGLTETFGPIAVNEWRARWDDRPAEERAARRARQGVANVVSEPLRIIDDEGHEVPPDGVTTGEVAVRGNNVMLGYYRDEAATAAAATGRWFRTGDLAVMHPDGYVEIRDRRKDIIISGGENIASVEVERALDSHPAVLESAVVGVPDARWGEVPIAFVTLRPGGTATPSELTGHVRAKIAGYKAPKAIVYAELPKSPTGKIRKDVLRARARGGASQ